MQYCTDSQVAAFVVNAMGGNARLFPVVLRIWRLCLELDVELEVVWFPREAPNQQVADALSKGRITPSGCSTLWCIAERSCLGCWISHGSGRVLPGALTSTCLQTT